MKLADRILAEDLERIRGDSQRPHDSIRKFHFLEDNETLQDRLISPIPRIDLQSVANWWNKVEGPLDLYTEAFHCLSPPWTEAWMEFRDGASNYIGYYMNAYNWQKTGYAHRIESRWDQNRESLRIDGSSSAVPEYPWFSANLPVPLSWDSAVEWVMNFSLFLFNPRVEDKIKKTMGPAMQNAIAVNKDGALLDWRWFHMTNKLEDVTDNLNGPLQVPLAAIDLFHCKNVSLGDEAVDPKVAAARAKKARKRGQRPPLKFNTIKIEVGKLSRSRRYKPNEDPSPVPFHRVPGHFAHYGNCCPGKHAPKGLLFGRIEGRFFIPPHVRGNPEHGTNLNDYEFAELQ